MKMNRYIIAVCVGLAMLASGCVANYGEINKDPNLPYEKDRSETDVILGLFPAMVNTILHSQQNRSQHTEQMVGQYGGHLSTSANWSGTNFANFNPSQVWIDIPWTDGYAGFYVNYTRVRELTKGEGYIFQMANIIRVASQHRMADIYGPIPYSQYSQAVSEEGEEGETEETPGYDSVKDVYVTMINDLTAAIDALTVIVENTPGTPVPVGPYDFVYGASTGSELAKWVRYANSLKLRLAVRIAHKNDPAGFALQAIDEVMNHSIGPILSNADNAFNSSTPENESAGYHTATSWGDVKVNATLTTYMNALNDPRTSKYMKAGTQATPYDYTGNIGVRMGAVTAANNVYFDFDLEPEVPPATYTIMNVMTPEPVMLFCAAETHFLLAEAAVRGWYAGDAKQLYEAGIQRSMEQYGVGMGSYMTETITAAEGVYMDPRETHIETDPNTGDEKSVDAVTGFDIYNSFVDLKPLTEGGSPQFELAVAWDAQDTDEKKIEAIITQKWIANYRLGIEAWSDWRRTGYPRIFPGVNNNSDKVNNPDSGIRINDVRMARRIPYPSIERNANPKYSDAVGMLGGEDEMTTELWWALGNR